MSDREFYVYLYRDPETDEIRYVGKGTGSRVDAVVRDVYECDDPDERTRKLAVSDKKEVRNWFAQLERRGLAPSIEIMPCEDEAQALAVEAGIISALWGEGRLYNKVRGHRREFAPLGLPPELSRRRFDPPLTRSEVEGLGGAVVVYISGRSFFEGDIRKGSAPRLGISKRAKQQQREDAHARIRRWWQTGKFVRAWAANPQDAPELLIAVTGPASRRWVWGSLPLDRHCWHAAEPIAGGLYELPTRRSSPITDDDFDAKRLRGRLITPGEFGGRLRNGIRQFNSIRAEQFDVVQRRA